MEDSRDGLDREGMKSLQVLEQRVNLIEQEYMQSSREKEGQLTRLEEV